MALSSEKGGGPFVAFNAITACPLCTNLSINDETLAAFLGRSYTAPAGALVPSSRRISRSLAVASSRTATSAGSLPCRDAAPQAVDGYFRILPCVDDVINVAGHRLGTKALESACLTVEEVAAAAAP